MRVSWRPLTLKMMLLENQDEGNIGMIKSETKQKFLSSDVSILLHMDTQRNLQGVTNRGTGRELM